MIPTKQNIEREIGKMQRYNEIGKEDVVTKRIMYAMSEMLRWSIEDTVGWESPLSQAISHAKILKNEMRSENEPTKKIGT